MRLSVWQGERFSLFERYSRTGWATPMRGKSQTCREAASLFPRSPTVHSGHRPPEIMRSASGKSETCRASAWQSHHQRSFARVEFETAKTGRASAWLSHHQKALLGIEFKTAKTGRASEWQAILGLLRRSRVIPSLGNEGDSSCSQSANAG